MSKDYSPHFPTVTSQNNNVGENKEDDSDESRHRETFKFNSSPVMYIPPI
jgi:hypothetical protein